MVFTTAVLATAITTSLNSQLSAQGMDGAQSEQIAQGIIDGATSEDLSAQYSVPVADVDTIGDDLSVAMVDGLHLVATTGSVIALPCAGAFRVAVRRQGFQG